MVALRRPEQLAPPARDGLCLAEVRRSQIRAEHLWARFSASATERRAIGSASSRSIYIDFYSGPGVCEIPGARDLAWDASILALSQPILHDCYVLNVSDDAHAAALHERAARLGVPGAVFFHLDADQDEAFGLARDFARIEVIFGPKILITRGHPSNVVLLLKLLLRDGRRQVLARVGSGTSVLPWDDLVKLTYGERALDLLAVFPRLSGRHDAAAMERVDEGATERALRLDFARRLERQVGLKTAYDGMGVVGSPLNDLLFASTAYANAKAWQRLIRDCGTTQDELYLGSA